MTIDTKRIGDLIAAHPDWDLRRIAAEVEGVGDGPTTAEQAEARNRQALRSAAYPAGSEPAEPLNSKMLRTFHETKASGARHEAAFGAGIDVLFTAAMNPDHPQHAQAVYDHDEWHRQQGWGQVSGARS